MLVQQLASIFSSNPAIFHRDSAPRVSEAQEEKTVSAKEKVDSVEISKEGLIALIKSEKSEENAENNSKKKNDDELTEEQKKEVEKLKERDREVRQHEQAHAASAGPYAIGGPQYEYENGPDGKQYAVGGHVSIDTSPEANPEATIAKAQVIRKAAMAPSDPSSQDKKVAQSAAKMEREARAELREEKSEKSDGGGKLKGYGETPAEQVGSLLDQVA